MRSSVVERVFPARFCGEGQDLFHLLFYIFTFYTETDPASLEEKCFCPFFRIGEDGQGKKMEEKGRKEIR